jgi:protein phosphatase
VIGGRRRTEVHIVEESLASGDRLLLSTDGVHGSLDESGLARLILNPAGVSAAAADIVRHALARGSSDNCTAVVARYEPDRV